VSTGQVSVQRAPLAPTAEPTRRGWRFGRAEALTLGRIGLLVAVLVAWEAWVSIARLPVFLVPAPSRIARYLWTAAQTGLNDPDSLWVNIGYTLLEGMVGFVLGSLLGFGLALVVAQMPRVERLFWPLIVGFQSLPKVAVAPLIVVWFGIGLSSKIVLVALLAFFPVLVNTLLGFRSIEEDRLDLARGLTASEQQIFWHIKLPSALPYLFIGLDMAILFGITGTIVGEFLGGQFGLGVQILKLNFKLNISGTFGVLLVLSLLGVAVSAGLRLIRARVLFWAPIEQADVNI
jgi:NitT/TauT family transport system permease protein